MCQEEYHPNGEPVVSDYELGVMFGLSEPVAEMEDEEYWDRFCEDAE